MSGVEEIIDRDPLYDTMFYGPSDEMIEKYNEMKKHAEEKEAMKLLPEKINDKDKDNFIVDDIVVSSGQNEKKSDRKSSVRSSKKSGDNVVKNEDLKEKVEGNRRCEIRFYISPSFAKMFRFAVSLSGKSQQDFIVQGLHKIVGEQLSQVHDILSEIESFDK